MNNLTNTTTTNTEIEMNNEFGFTFNDLLQLDIPEREEIVCGLGRGEVGLLNAVNNVGKTTLLRNLMISLCSSREFTPLTKSNAGRRVAFLDFEDSLSFLREDLTLMASNLSIAEQELFKNNAMLFCDVRDRNDQDFSLSNSEHLRLLIKRLKFFRPDLIIVDTISSAFRINNENDNAQVRQIIMFPLKRIAKDCDAALIATHHIGKQKSEEGQTREASHKGRGASALADLSRVVLNLERDNVGDGVILSCPKIKGKKFEDTLFRLDQDKRWFSEQGIRREPSNYESLIEMFDDGEEHTTQDAITEFEKMISTPSVKRLLKDAVKRGDLRKVSHGIYQKY